MNRKQIYKIFKDLVLEKLKMIEKEKNGYFALAWGFEGNALGQVGETFVKTIFNENGYNVDLKHIHDEYDIIIENKKIEIKTAKIGNNKSFQFNGINPKYNYDLIICIGLELNSIKYKLFTSNQIFYDHKQRSHLIRYNFKDKIINKKLTSMNPGNEVNKKVTLSTNHMCDDIENMFQKSINCIK
ncbi:hypothetical protein [Spiroplasma melliferum]|uniref:Restriction endonuclease n=2 Tax=Spiroplasma melliferum TaxID=2134 RepID=A0AAI9T327_SPIME|nr:hypothetical protein [Spiroplasma melliferum]ELL44212.1 hypothetical protein SMIPMB4A_v3c9450 [Spiroplasma melliferum IPMB4A]KAI92342.1 hypothetical protein SPM_006425 [Spiroplasma melliferum KC3]QCO23776.1 hypothetical protein SRED_002250 [Spiroplasma melliferum]QCO23804.1 hypothetical protein SRED_002278 [Spiroplasma melliferum]